MQTAKCSCGTWVDSAYSFCPKCGAKIESNEKSASNSEAIQSPPSADPLRGSGKKIIVTIIAILAVYLTLTFLVRHSDSDSISPSYDYSSASYQEVNNLVGCGSTYSDEKKRDVFNTRFRDHWMSWSGTIVLADANSISVDIDGTGIQDLQVDLANHGAGYNLEKGQHVIVRFLMKRSGGCFLPFSGEKATFP